MEVLKTLSPAQTRVILAPNSSKVSELLRLTFIDLILKRVLAIRESEYCGGMLEVFRGEKYNTWSSKYHEKIFTEVFNDTPELCITMDELIKLVKSEIGSSKKYKWRYLIEPELSKYFHPQPLFKVFGVRIKLNDEGLALKNDIEKYLNRVTPKLRNKSPKISEINDIYESLGSNFLLIKGYESKYLKRFFHKVHKEESKKKKMSQSVGATSYDGVSVSDTGSNFIGTPLLDSIILYEILEFFEGVDSIVSSNFETSFSGFDDSKPGWFESGFDWSADSLFGSDNGHSGCSGCSGCGGCGGGD